MSTGLALAPDAAMALGIASTAMPFARTREDEAERWLRVLRLHGQVGIALQALGVSEMPLTTRAERARASASSSTTSAGAGGGEDDTVARVTEQAIRIAGERDAPALTTTDVLMAVMRVYGDDFDRVLRVHGAEREEVLERLGLCDLPHS
jgi:hypothetical protein